MFGLPPANPAGVPLSPATIIPVRETTPDNASQTILTGPQDLRHSVSGKAKPASACRKLKVREPVSRFVNNRVAHDPFPARCPGRGSELPSCRRGSACELRIQRGRKVRFLFDNPDHQIHNVVICKPDSSGLVGALADKMALDPRAHEHQYVPRDQAVLWSTPLVDAGQQFKLSFTAPALRGRYPILCTYPGHWRLMRATLIVE